MVENAKVVQNPHSVQADTHDYFLPRPGRLSSKNGADRHDYFLRRPKAGRLRPSSESVPLSRSGPCGSVGWCSKCCTRTLTIYGVARGLVGGPGVPKSCTRTPTLTGWCSHCCADGVVFQKLGWCSKKLSQNPRWDGIPKVGMVFQKVVPESHLCILLDFTTKFLQKRPWGITWPI